MDIIKFLISLHRKMGIWLSLQIFKKFIDSAHATVKILDSINDYIYLSKSSFYICGENFGNVGIAEKEEEFFLSWQVRT